MIRLAYGFALLSLIATASACGGGGDEAPGPLKVHLDEAYIAQVPLDQKTAMLQAQNNYQRAKAENMKAEADYKEAGTQLDIAKNEKKQAELERQSAQRKKKDADDSGDQNRVNLAMRDVHVGDLAVQAADKKVKAAEAHRQYLKKWVRYTEENVYAAEARYELSKAKLAQSKNISPKGFKVKDYVDQETDRSHRAQRAKLISDRERDKWNQKQKDYLASQKQVDQARGVGTGTTTATPGPTSSE